MDCPALAAMAVPLVRCNCAASAAPVSVAVLVECNGLLQAAAPAALAAAVAECYGLLQPDAPAVTAVSLARCNCAAAVVPARVVTLAVLPSHPRVRRGCRD